MEYKDIIEERSQRRMISARKVEDTCTERNTKAKGQT